MKTIQQTITFRASPETLYALYIDAKKHAAVIGSKVRISAKPGSRMTAWDGYCWGTMLHAIPAELIVQTWRNSDWKPDEPDSVLVLAFEKTGSGTRLVMTHANVPDREHASLSEGWKEHYWTHWKKHLAGT